MQNKLRMFKVAVPTFVDLYTFRKIDSIKIYVIESQSLERLTRRQLLPQQPIKAEVFLLHPVLVLVHLQELHH